MGLCPVTGVDNHPIPNNSESRAGDCCENVTIVNEVHTSSAFIPKHDALSLFSTYPASHPQVNDPSVLAHTCWQMLGPAHSSTSSPLHKQ